MSTGSGNEVRAHHRHRRPGSNRVGDVGRHPRLAEVDGIGVDCEWVGEGGLVVGHAARLKQPKLRAATWTISAVTRADRSPGRRNRLASHHRQPRHRRPWLGVTVRCRPTSAAHGADRRCNDAKIGKRYVATEAEGLKRQCEGSHDRRTAGGGVDGRDRRVVAGDDPQQVRQRRNGRVRLRDANADLLRTYLGSTGLDLQGFEPTPGRASLVARIEGSDPTAPSLCLMGHTDVVPVNESGWSRDPFGGELINGEVWGRGAVDMLNLTATMAMAFRHLAMTGFRPRGDLIYFAVADEESGSAHGMQWMADHELDSIRADYVLTESGGLHSGSNEQPSISVAVGEKGVAWRLLRVRGTPGHGSTPFKADNALMTAAAVIQRLGAYRPAPRFHEMWTTTVDRLGVDDEAKRNLLDETLIDDYLESLPRRGSARSCTPAPTPPSPPTPSPVAARRG